MGGCRCGQIVNYYSFLPPRRPKGPSRIAGAPLWPCLVQASTVLAATAAKKQFLSRACSRHFP